MKQIMKKGFQTMLQGLYLLLAAISVIAVGVMLFSDMTAASKVICAVMWSGLAVFMYRTGISVMKPQAEKTA